MCGDPVICCGGGGGADGGLRVMCRVIGDVVQTGPLSFESTVELVQAAGHACVGHGVESRWLVVG